MKIAIIIGAVILFSALCVVGLFLIRRTLYNMIDRRIERFQSELIEKQVREIQNMYRQVRGWRHDYRNHINNMKIQLSEGNYDKLSDYLNELADDLDTVDTVIKTGNVMADAILNSKLNVAEKMNIKLNVKANVPDKLPMSDVELCSMLGNILDNAIEAAQIPDKDRYIKLDIKYKSGAMFITLKNSYDGRINAKNGVLKTIKSNKIEHGIGLNSVQEVVQKYNGEVEMEYDDREFCIMIVLYMNNYC